MRFHFRFILRSLTAFCFLTAIYGPANAQYEWLATVDYTTLAINRIGNIPGVTWVIQDNSTYDQNNQRFFFQGNANRVPPWNLYTLDAVTGAVIYSPLCPAGGGGGSAQEVLGLQYDNGNDTLYGVYQATASFSWIDPATGAVHAKASIPGYGGYQWSAYDTKDHFYIVGSGSSMIVIDALTGNELYNSPLSNMSDVVYDNLTGKLYGINSSFAMPNPQFDSITLATGALHPIANLPPLGLPQANAYAIDENAGKYIFLGSDPSGVTCYSTYLYVLDINTGAVISKTVYPYSVGATVISNQNLIEYSFDNKRGTLYALNWYPPAPPPLVTISADPTPSCAGVPISFTATPGAGVTNPAYQWQLNGNNTGTNDPVYTNSGLSVGDSVRCILTNNPGCIPALKDTSGAIGIGAPVQASINIQVTAETICTNDQVSFAAHRTNSGAAPVFQWTLNGTKVGTNDSIYNLTQPMNGDSIYCILTTNANCVLPGPDSSNLVVIQYNELNSSITISDSPAAVCSGDTMMFTATTTNAGASPSFQWQINGIDAGSGKDTLLSSVLQDGDLVSCTMTGGVTCRLPFTSNKIVPIIKAVPSLFAGNDTVISPGQRVILDPSVSGPAIVSYQWTPATYLDNSSLERATATPVITTTYRLLVTADDDCTAAGKLTIIVYRKLSMPNAFMPGTGVDDVFRIPPSTTQPIRSFRVFNRWGQLLFSTTNSGGGWDGNFNGQPQPAGTYAWMIQYVDGLTNKPEMASGTVELIR